MFNNNSDNEAIKTQSRCRCRLLGSLIDRIVNLNMRRPNASANINLMSEKQYKTGLFDKKKKKKKKKKKTKKKKNSVKVVVGTEETGSFSKRG